MKIANIFADEMEVRWRLGFLNWDEKREHAMVALDLVELLPLLRQYEEDVLYAAAQPFASIESPPFIEAGDIQTGRKRRVKLGYIYTESDAHGVMYQIRLDTKTLLKRWDVIFCHVHIPEPDELEKEGKNETRSRD